MSMSYTSANENDASFALTMGDQEVPPSVDLNMPRPRVPAKRMAGFH